MSAKDDSRQSNLIKVLREGVGLVQMVFFKELKSHLVKSHPDKTQQECSMLAGAITNDLFGTPNPEPVFVAFYQQNRITIEQEMLGLASNLPHLRRYITDALRVQTLCDNQEGQEESSALVTAAKIGILLKEREVPLPSSFMTSVRELGAQHQLIMPPVEISSDDDQSLVH